MTLRESTYSWLANKDKPQTSLDMITIESVGLELLYIKPAFLYSTNTIYVIQEQRVLKAIKERKTDALDQTNQGRKTKLEGIQSLRTSQLHIYGFRNKALMSFAVTYE